MATGSLPHRKTPAERSELFSRADGGLRRTSTQRGGGEQRLNGQRMCSGAGISAVRSTAKAAKGGELERLEACVVAAERVFPYCVDDAVLDPAEDRRGVAEAESHLLGLSPRQQHGVDGGYGLLQDSAS